ncbi:UDP binding domain-containing protein [Streptomyces sp. CC208A]|uniref:UDP binding domain-containing protein n=1 Tax=Streptomyces sp. CC208A TaxID=3044573 RepID=UPI0032C01DAD
MRGVASGQGSRVLLLGLAYKKNTGDTRETPAARVIELPARMGAEVRAADPHVAAGVHVPKPVVPG